MNEASKAIDESLQQTLSWWESLQDEVFRFQHEGHTLVWSITKANRIIEEKPREPDFFRPFEQGVTRENIQARYPALDWEYARTVDLTKPLLFVPYRGLAQLVDGWHRLARAVLERVAELPAYLLTEEEASECLVLHRMPEGGSG